jgi:fumarate hydratase class II
MSDSRRETDSMGVVEVPADRLWGAQTQRSLEHFCIGRELMPREMIAAYATLKKAAARANHASGRLGDEAQRLIVAVCDEILAGRHQDMFPLHVWISGSGTQFNMNVNEVVSNRAIEMAGGVVGSKKPIHPNDDVNKSQSSNDVFPTAMSVAAVRILVERVVPSVRKLRDELDGKAKAFATIVKIGRTHLQDATPLTLGQEISGWVAQLDHGIRHVEQSLPHLCELALGGTAVGTGLNAHVEYAPKVAALLARKTGLPFVTAPNKFEALAANDALVFAHGALKTLAAALFKIANDVRWLACGPRCRLRRTRPSRRTSRARRSCRARSIPRRAEALAMLALQVMANDVAVGFGGASGYLEMNVYKPLIIHNLSQSISLLSDGCTSFRRFLVEGTQPNRQKIGEYVDRSLMLVTALVPLIGYDRAARIAHHALEHDLTLKAAALALGFVGEAEFDRIVDPARMVRPQGAGD